MRVYLISLILLLVSPGFYLQAQLSRGGRPLPYKGLKDSTKILTVKPPQALKTIREEVASDKVVSGKKPFKFAQPLQVSINPENSGEWSLSEKGMKIWRMEINAPGSYATGLTFSNFRLTGDAMVFVYTPSQQNVLGGFNHLSNKESGILPVQHLPGDELVIELQVPSGADYGSLEIGEVSAAFADIFGLKDGRFGLSGSCEVDINCPEGEDWLVIKRAVCRVYVAAKGEFCTGVLINNVKNDQTAYLYTANHCISTAAHAQSTVFIFGYESELCDGTDGSVANSLASAQLLATSDSLDFTLLLLSEAPPDEYNPFYAGWSLSSSPPPSGICIHHPQGDVKKISFENNNVLTTYQTVNPPSWLAESTPEAFWRIARWDVGTTEGGSSGSPLFDPNQRIIGNLTGGDATCANPVNDYFSKFYKNWNYYPDPARSLKSWLDPNGTGISALNGLDPFNLPEDPALFEVYPNPSNGRFSIFTGNLDLGDLRIRVYTIQGRRVADFASQEPAVAGFNLQHLQPGTYILEIISDTSVSRKKFIIAR
jgi:hypothetical protein